MLLKWSTNYYFQVPGGSAGNPLRPGHRCLVAWLHPGGDAHRRAALLRRQRDRPDEQNRWGPGHPAKAPARPGAQNEEVLPPVTRRLLQPQPAQRWQEVSAAQLPENARRHRGRDRRARCPAARRTGPLSAGLSQVQGSYFANARLWSENPDNSLLCSAA